MDGYQVDEIKERVDLDSETLKNKKRVAEDDYVLAKQLLKNIEAKRIQITKDYYECDKSNVSRKLAVKSLKDRIDE